MDHASSDLPRVVDPLADALHHLRMDGVFYCRSDLGAPWGLYLPNFDDCLFFHVVTEGECWLEGPGLEPTLLRQGDLAVLPRAVGHDLRSEPGVSAPNVLDLPHDFVSEQYAILRHGGDGVRVGLTCGAVRFGHPAAKRLIDALPSLIHLRHGADAVEWLPATLGLLAAETRHTKPGGEAVITRLCDIVVIQAIRSWLQTGEAERSGWLGALRDPAIGTALTMVHRRPDREWTTAGLAAEVAMSRSAFSARFTELVGESVMQYVTTWRMEAALDLLADPQLTVAEVAARLGYRSEAAFSRAFKRVIGASPGVARRRQRPDAVSGIAG